MRRLSTCALVAAACATTDERAAELAAPFTQQCPTQVIEGVDVYSGDGTVDWTKVAAAGRAFAFVKATQGNYDKQSTFAADWAGTKAAGVLRSPYHFFDATIDGVAQATWFLDELTAAGGLAAGDLPPMLDIECPTSSSQSSASPNCEYTGDSGWAPSATIAQRAFDWLTTVAQATGRTPVIYSYPSWFGDVGFTDARLAAYPLFIATYASCAAVPAPWTSAAFWQYSDTGSVSGIAAQVDEDRFIGTAGDLGALTASGDAGVAGDAGTAPPMRRGGCGCRSDGEIDLGLGLGLALGLALTRRRARRCQ